MTKPVQFIPMTPRAFLASLTPPLAVNHDGARGRFSKEGVAALDTARADGFLFIGDPGHPDTAAPKAKREPKAPKATVVKSTVPAQPKAPAVEVDPKEVRAWAKQNGHEVGDRGRLNQTVVTAFLASGGKAVGKGAKPVTAKAAAPRVRKQTVAWGLIPRRKNDPAYLSQPILGIRECSACRLAVSHCPCEQGPRMPKKYGSGIAALRQADAVANPVTEVTA